MANAILPLGCMYKLTFPNGKAYIGITKRSLQARFAAHAQKSKEGKSNCAVHHAIRKYGAHAIKVEEIARAEFRYLLELEVLAIARFNTRYPNGYNLTDGGDGVTGMVVTAETRAKIGAAGKRKVMSAEARAKISAAQKGRRHSAEAREKIRAANIGRKASAETLLKMSKSLKGKAISAEHRAALSKFHTGRPKSAEAIAKRAETIALKKAAIVDAE